MEAIISDLERVKPFHTSQKKILDILPANILLLWAMWTRKVRIYSADLAVTTGVYPLWLTCDVSLTPLVQRWCYDAGLPVIRGLLQQ